MVNTATTFTTPISTPSLPPRSGLETALQAVLEHARRLTAMYGTGGIEVALAWETVEELETAKAKQCANLTSTFERYCAAYPDAPECRVYED